MLSRRTTKSSSWLPCSPWWHRSNAASIIVWPSSCWNRLMGTSEGEYRRMVLRWQTILGSYSMHQLWWCLFASSRTFDSAHTLLGQSNTAENARASTLSRSTRWTNQSSQRIQFSEWWGVQYDLLQKYNLQYNPKSEVGFSRKTRQFFSHSGDPNIYFCSIITNMWQRRSVPEGRSLPNFNPIVLQKIFWPP